MQALLSSMQKHNLDLSKLSGIVTAGDPSMIGSKIGMTTPIRTYEAKRNTYGFNEVSLHYTPTKFNWQKLEFRYE